MTKLSGLVVANSRKYVPLKSAHIEAKVVGTSVKVVIEHEYENPTSETIQVCHHFPLDNKGGVVEFIATMNGKTVRGCVKERKEAETDYNKAISQGKSAALLTRELDDPDVYKSEIGEMPGRALCKVRITYLAPLRIQGRKYELHLPTSIAPRYSPDQTISTSSTYSLPTSGGLMIKIHLKMGSFIKGFSSTTHPFRLLQQTNQNEALLELTQDVVGLDKNFVVEIEVTDVEDPVALVAATPQETIVQVKISPPQVDISKALTLPIELIFVVDRSGSMSGPPLISVQKAMMYMIRSLSSACRFNIISFGSDFQVMFPKGSVDNTQENITFALAEINKWSADMGGTEILRPLNHVYSQLPLPTHPRQIFLLTDGDVSNVSQIVSVVGMHSCTTRLSTIGIGNYVSRALVENVARAGKGQAIFINDNESVVEKMVLLLEQCTQPCIMNIELDGPTTTNNVLRVPCAPIYGGGMGFSYFVFPTTSVALNHIKCKFIINGGEVRQVTIPVRVLEAVPDIEMIQKQCWIQHLGNLEHDHDLKKDVFKVNNHPHPLTKRPMKPNEAWECDGCKAKSNILLERYNCLPCDFDLCERCHRSHGGEILSDSIKNESIACSVKHQLLSKWTGSVMVWENEDFKSTTILPQTQPISTHIASQKSYSVMGASRSGRAWNASAASNHTFGWGSSGPQNESATLETSLTWKRPMACGVPIRGFSDCMGSNSDEEDVLEGEEEEVDVKECKKNDIGWLDAIIECQKVNSSWDSVDGVRLVSILKSVICQPVPQTIQEILNVLNGISIGDFFVMMEKGKVHSYWISRLVVATIRTYAPRDYAPLKMILFKSDSWINSCPMPITF